MPTFTQLASDTFARASLGTTNWTLTQAAFGFLIDTTAGDGGAYGQYGEQALPADHAWAWWSGAAAGLTDSQYSAIKSPQWVGFAANAGMGCAVQVAAGTSRTGYELYVVSLTGVTNLYKWSAGTRTLVAGPVTLSLAANDVLTLAITSGSLTAHVNGGAAIAGLSYTDPSPLTGGRPGMTAATGPRAIDWYGGNAVASTALAFTGTVGAQSGTVGTAFSWAGSALSSFFSGGTAPYVYAIASGTLPAGLTLNASTGVVSGTPTAAGSGSVTFRVTDAASAQASSNSVGFTVAAAPATAVTLTGPSGGQVGTASSNFTAGANGDITGPVTVTPSDSSGGGTFSPTSVAISSGSPTATFTYTPGTAGTKSISVTNSGGLTNPSAVSYVASTTPGRMLFPDTFRNNAGTLLASKAVTLHYHHPTTGALVVQVDTTTDAGGIIGTVTNASLALSTNYRVDYKFSTGEYGVVYRTTEAT